MSARLLHGIVLSVCQICFTNAYATGLLGAVRHNESPAVTALVAAGADVNEQGPQSDAPLHWAAFNGNPELVQSLIDAGANIDDRLANGNTPLHLAGYKGHVVVVEILLNSGADATLRNRDGETPLELARRNRHQAATERLARFIVQSRTAISSSQPLRPASVRPVEEAATNSPAAIYRIQLMAVSSEELAQRALVDYRDRFGDLLMGEKLLLEKASRPIGLLYRIQYGPLSFNEAEALCTELKRREQACLVRTSPST